MSLKKILILTFLITTMTFINYTSAKDPGIPLIPMPEKVEWAEGTFTISTGTVVNSSEVKLSEYIKDQIKVLTGIKLSESSENSGSQLVLRTDPGFNPGIDEAYKIIVSSDKIEITGNAGKGIFRGIQTFLQMIDPAAKVSKDNKEIKIPQCTISDKPVFAWRGLNFDCSRHFRTKDFVKRYIDILAYYKFNTLHWHLTDDQGWRIEIKKYPKLTEVGAWRKEADGTTYGGFYTQDDIKEIIEYAKSRYINVVPEIEMPGHSLASLSSYPENSCTGGPFEVTNLWGVFKDIYCAGRDSTFFFLQDVLDEVITLFPGEYIHIGGDEAPKDRWKECPRCQARIKAEGLKDEHELQSYFIKRISNYLYSKGKKVIGWGEILEGGLAPGAIVQSWMDFNAAVQSAKQKHYTIVSPASHTYLDYSPEDLDLRIAYSFNPIPAELTGEEAKYVIGSEVNLWAERAPQETVDSKLFPRTLALAEVFWSNPKERNYDEFYSRVQKAYADLTALGIKFGAESKAYFPKTKYDESGKHFTVEMTMGQKEIDVRYTADGSEVTASSALYEEPVIVDKTATVKFAAFKDGQNIGKKYSLSFDFHKALNAKLTLETPYSERYRAAGDNTVIDGVRGTNDFHDANWQGYDGTDFAAVIDLGKETTVNKVVPRFILASNSWVFLPVKVTVSVSKDGKNFTDSKEYVNDINQKNSDIILKDYICGFNNQQVRYIKVHAENMKTIPDWHPGAGNKAWIFIDEIVVE